MVSGLLAKIGIPVIVSILSDILGGVDSPVAKTASNALKEFDKAMRDGEVDLARLQIQTAHVERIAELEMQEYRASLAEINQSLRAEAQSDDLFVRRMRPTFGYIMALSWGAQMFALAYIYYSIRVEPD